MNPGDLEDVWRREAPHVLGALLRRYGDLGGCEDAAQEALIAAVTQWPRDGVPSNPRGWLLRVASRRVIDARRSDSARADRESAVAALAPAHAGYAPAADSMLDSHDNDDVLHLMILCCDPALSRPSQIALALRAVGGLTTAQIAAGFLVPETTMAQRISRAKGTLRSAGARFAEPTAAELQERIAAVGHVLHLIFTEGYATSGGAQLIDVSLAGEAIRLTRQLRAAVPGDDETAGLLALMLLTHARSAARTDSRGDLVPLEQQERSRWDSGMIREGVGILQEVLPAGPVGTFQLQAAIAAVHAEAATWEDTDWLQITMLYRMLERVTRGPAVTLNLAVAVGMAHGPEAGLSMLEPLQGTKGADCHRVLAVRAHLLEMAGLPDVAADGYADAARITASLPEQRYLNARAAQLAPGDTGTSRKS